MSIKSSQTLKPRNQKPAALLAISKKEYGMPPGSMAF
jgi:hypothetical protein